ncbi:MAG TPA: hypothetical protein VFN73_12980 [Propionibacteriaceae bacterium]|nr:hypothetical protein [Propionibacteriaceae bacterium]
MARIDVPSHGSTAGADAWRSCVGTGRISLALRSDYLRSLELVQREIGFRHIRGHGLLHDDMGVYRPYEWEGEPHVAYGFGYVDAVFDAWLSLGIRPFVELGFMPSALASGTQTVFWWHGNVTPPSSYGQWAELIRHLFEHLVDRYGRDEVRSWPVEVWNEPNLEGFWEGARQEEYFRLYEVTVRAVKDVDPQIQVGGPAICGGGEAWLPAFLDFCHRKDLPADFLSRHAYSSSPASHVPFGTYQSLAPVQSLLDDFASARTAAAAASPSLPVHITEFNTSYRPDNPVHDTCYNAAYLGRVLSEGGESADSFSYWTFCDVFEEDGVPLSIFHGGFGLLTHQQIKKPTFHLYAFFARLGPEILYRDDRCHVRRTPAGAVQVVAWNPVDDAEEAAPTARLQLDLPLPSGPVFVNRSRVHERAGNPWGAWQAMGRPHQPSPAQVETLRRLAEPHRTSWQQPSEGGVLRLDLDLERNEITLVELEPVRDETASYPGLDDRLVPGYGG